MHKLSLMSQKDSQQEGRRSHWNSALIYGILHHVLLNIALNWFDNESRLPVFLFGNSEST